jgi:hypothetical protein
MIKILIKQYPLSLLFITTSILVVSIVMLITKDSNNFKHYKAIISVLYTGLHANTVS